MTTAAGVIAGGIGKGFEDLEGRLQKSLSIAAVMLGHKAKGYRWAATGPDYYDCSGLIWRATQLIGYKGARFTTATLPGLKQFRRLQDREVNVDDIVHWPAGHGGVTGHMGVVTGGDMFYSARSVRSGIGEAKISTFRKAKPRYYRYIGG
jgi:peptidoglycan DL-endopeptidase CwlO